MWENHVEPDALAEKLTWKIRVIENPRVGSATLLRSSPLLLYMHSGFWTKIFAGPWEKYAVAELQFCHRDSVGTLVSLTRSEFRDIITLRQKIAHRLFHRSCAVSMNNHHRTYRAEQAGI